MSLSDLVFVIRGPAASRPAGAPSGKQRGWFATDTGVLSIWDGSSWIDIASGGAVDSVFGRTGVVAAATSDYDAVQVDFTPAGTIAATNTQAAVEEVASDAAAAVSSEASTRAAADAVLVPKSLFDANTILKADSDDTPTALTMGASTILARLAAGNIVAATPSELRTLLALVIGTNVEAWDADLDALADLNSATGKTTPVDADLFALWDSAASFAAKKLTGTNLKAFLKAYFDTLYGPASGGIGAEVDYVEFTGTVSVTATTEATANTVVTGAGFTADGTSAYLIQFYSPQARPDTASAGRQLHLWLYQDGTSIGRLGTFLTPAAANDSKPVMLFRRMIPASGSRTFSIRADVNAGTGAVVGGAGGTATDLPGFIRITKVT